MVVKSLQGFPQEATTRIERGRELYAELGYEIRFDQADKVWLVPSQHDATSVYEVTLGRRGESCECDDAEYRGEFCKHIVAATLAQAKTFRCDGCGERHPNRERVEVHTEHRPYGHGVLEGERYCKPCAHVHGVL